MKLPYAPVEFTAKGEVAHPEQVTAAFEMLDRARATDVLVIAHGWNNDLAAAQRLYDRLCDNVAAKIPAGSARRLAVIGVLWPSIRWADDDQIAGGGVAVGDPQAELVAAIEQSVDDPERRARMIELAGRLDTAQGRADFLAEARGMLPAQPADRAPDEDPEPSALRRGDPEGVFDSVRVAVADVDELAVAAPTSAASGAPGVAPDLLADEADETAGGETVGAGLFGMSWAELGQQVLNTTTYYTMKARAGDVGANGVAPLIDRINATPPDRRVHLAGHSFGARVVSAAATNVTSTIDSLTLLQGAFSHYGFTANFANKGRDGAFRGAITGGHLQGPLVITCTHNDRAVRLAYAIASRLAGQAGAGVGDRDDLYGGIGANGSVGSHAVEGMLGDAGTRYTFPAGSINNLKADATISGHSDVTNPAVANALAQAMGVG